MAGVQIESHTPPCAHEGRRVSLVNPSLPPGDCFTELVLSPWDGLQLPLNTPPIAYEK